MSTRGKRAQRRTGFTLVELMVALAVGGIVIGAMYSMGAASTRTFQTQHQIANMQSSLRFAFVQLKRDIMRAGFLAIPNGSAQNAAVCSTNGFPVGPPGGPGLYAGVSSFFDNVMPNIVDPSGVGLNAPGIAPARGFSHDQVTLIGNYATSNQYVALDNISPAGNSATLNLLPGFVSHALHVDFGWNPANGTATQVLNPAEVLRAFPNGGLIRIQTKTGDKSHLAVLTSAPVINANQILFTFFPPLVGDCLTDAAGGWIAPLQVIRYGVNMSAPGTLDTDRVTGNAFAQLTRTTLGAAPAMLPIAAPRPILDYVATFNLAFTMTPPNPNQDAPDNYTIGQRANAVQVNTNPESLRSVEIELGVRAPDVDPGMRWPCPEQACMALFPTTVVGSPAARVRVLRSEVFLPNIAYEGR